jgi:hypothetical protein
MKLGPLQDRHGTTARTASSVAVGIKHIKQKNTEKEWERTKQTKMQNKQLIYRNTMQILQERWIFKQAKNDHYAVP